VLEGGGPPLPNCVLTNERLLVASGQNCPCCSLSGSKLGFLEAHMKAVHAKHLDVQLQMVKSSQDIADRLSSKKPAEVVHGRWNRTNDSDICVPLLPKITDKRREKLAVMLKRPEDFQLFESLSAGALIEASIVALPGLPECPMIIARVTASTRQGAVGRFKIKTSEGAAEEDFPRQGYQIATLTPSRVDIGKAKRPKAESYRTKQGLCKFLDDAPPNGYIELRLSPFIAAPDEAMWNLVLQKTEKSRNLTILEVNGVSAPGIMWHAAFGSGVVEPLVREAKMLKEPPATVFDMTTATPSSKPRESTRQLLRATKGEDSIYIVKLLPKAAQGCPWCLKKVQCADTKIQRHWSTLSCTRGEARSARVTTSMAEFVAQQKKYCDEGFSVAVFEFNAQGRGLDGEPLPIRPLDDEAEDEEPVVSPAMAIEFPKPHDSLPGPGAAAEARETSPQSEQRCDDGKTLTIPVPRSQRRGVEEMRESTTTYTPGQLMDDAALNERIQTITEAGLSETVKYFPPSVLAADVPLEDVSPGLNFAALHMEDPLHFVAVWWRGKKPQMVYFSDSMFPFHNQVREKVNKLAKRLNPRAKTSPVEGLKIADSQRINPQWSSTCGWAVINCFVGLNAAERVSRQRIYVPVDDLATVDRLRQRLELVKSSEEQARPEVPQIPMEYGEEKIMPTATAELMKLASLPENPPSGGSRDLPCPSRSTCKGQAIKFSVIRNFNLAAPKTLKLVDRGLSAGTRQAHRRVLREIVNLPSGFDHLDLDVAILEHYYRKKGERQWKWSMLSKELSNVAGALRRIRIYDPHFEPISLPLASMPAWVDATKAVRKMKAQEHPKQAQIIQWAQVEAFLQNPEVPEVVKQQVFICWLVAGRLGDVLQLRTEDITLDLVRPASFDQLHLTGEALSFKFVRGKGPQLTGQAYTVHTSIMPELKPLIQSILDRAGQKGWIWEFSSAAERSKQMDLVNHFLKQLDPGLTTRSIRRGAVQHLAEAGYPLADLRKITHHSSDEMLRIYLDMGKRDFPSALTGLMLGTSLQKTLPRVQAPQPILPQ